MLDPISIDMSEVVDELAPGDYKVTVADGEAKTSKNGNPYIRWQMNVVDHHEPKYNGKAIWFSTPTTGKGAFRLAQLYRAATKGEKMQGATLDPKAILGKTVYATIVNGVDQEGNASGFADIKSVRAV